VGGKGIQKTGDLIQPRLCPIEAELAILHEISALSLSSSPREFFVELVERAVRLLGVQRMGLRQMVNGQPELLASWGFPNSEDLEREIWKKDSRHFVFHFREGALLFLEAPWELSPREERLYTIFARRVEEILREAQKAEENVQRMQELEHLSLSDELTGLYNRRGFFALAEHQLLVARRSGKRVGIFMMDLDDFKWINDSFGHAIGDLVLSEFGRMLQEAFRKSDILARIGGDEFAVFVLDIDETKMEKMLSRLRALVTNWNASNQYPYSLDFSAGWVIVPPSQAREVRALLHEADQEMYREKYRKKASNPPF
ncbi:MAG: GGDEF domain-containing protein, partial [Atribacterota bacterium]